jgi:outer membrane receptor for monomeric catechols
MKRLVWCLGMALTPMGFVGQSAWAGDTGAENDQSTILVTGLREASASITGSHVPPLRYPQSVTVMNAQMLEKLGATRLDNALDLAGGVARQNDFGGCGTNIRCAALPVTRTAARIFWSIVSAAISATMRPSTPPRSSASSS